MTEADARAFVAGLAGVSRETLAMLDHFAALLTVASDQQNLIAASTVPNLWARHIADSAQLVPLADDAPQGPWLDLGSGPGLPGLIAAMMRPDRAVILVESRALRCNFLRDCVTTLSLRNVTVMQSRLETIPRFSAAVISARAFAPLPKLIKLSTDFSTDTTRWLLPKGRNAARELAELPRSWQMMFHVKHSATDADSGIIVGEGHPGTTGKGRA